MKHKRVWKACQRCRCKKIKCDSDSPCKHCRDDGQVCIEGHRMKVEQLPVPRGYADILESTHAALIATIQKLYSMVRNGEKWDFGDPELNEQGMPVVHNIAEMLQCVRGSEDHSWSWPQNCQEISELRDHLYTRNDAPVEAAQKNDPFHCVSPLLTESSICPPPDSTSREWDCSVSFPSNNSLDLLSPAGPSTQPRQILRSRTVSESRNWLDTMEDFIPGTDPDFTPSINHRTQTDSLLPRSGSDFLTAQHCSSSYASRSSCEVSEQTIHILDMAEVYVSSSSGDEIILPNMLDWNVVDPRSPWMGFSFESPGSL